MVNKQYVMVVMLMYYTIVGASSELSTIGHTNVHQQTIHITSSTYMGDYDDLVTCLDDEHDEFARLDQAPHHWTRWIACKEAFKAFYALVITKMRTLYCMCTRT